MHRNTLLTFLRQCTAIFCIAALASGTAAVANPTPPPQATSQDQSALLPADQLDSLVAPIALYPDPMLSNVLMASTYPL